MDVKDKIIEAKNVQKHYTDFDLIIDDFILYRGEIVGLVGENGAGKTTLLSILLNQIQYDSGTIMYLNNKHMSNQLKDSIGFVVGDKSEFNTSFTGEQLETILSNIYTKWDKDLFKQLAVTFKVPLNKKIEELSKGMSVKLNLALAMAHHPKILILDEVTSGLDPMVRVSVLQTIKEYALNNGVTVLFSTHITSDLDNIADRLCILHKGSLVFDDMMADIQSNYSITLDKDGYIFILRNNLTKNHYKLSKRELDNLSRNGDSWIPTVEDIMLFMIRGEKI